jgi:hypothetical protein
MKQMGFHVITAVKISALVLHAKYIIKQKILLIIYHSVNYVERRTQNSPIIILKQHYQ